MSWKCKNCGQKLNGKEKFCPECAEKTIYECKGCGKVMDNGKHRYCPICSTERAEKRKVILITEIQGHVLEAITLVSIEELVQSSISVVKRTVVLLIACGMEKHTARSVLYAWLIALNLKKRNAQN